MSDQNGTTRQPRKSKHRPSVAVLRQLLVEKCDEKLIEKSKFVGWSSKHRLALKQPQYEAIVVCFHRWARMELGLQYELTTSTRPLVPDLIMALQKFVECLGKYRSHHKNKSQLAETNPYLEADWKLYTNAIEQIYKSMNYTKNEASAFDSHEPTQLERAIDIVVSQYFDGRRYDFPEPYSWSQLGHLSEAELSAAHKEKAELAAKSKHRTPPVHRRNLTVDLLRIIRKDPSITSRNPVRSSAKSDVKILQGLYSLLGPEYGKVQDILWSNVESDYRDLAANKGEKKKQKEYDDIIKADAAALKKLKSKILPKKRKR